MDDENHESGPSTSADSHAGSRPITVTERNIGSSRLRNFITPSPLSMDNSEGTTRSFNTKSNSQPAGEVKLKLSDKAPRASFLGQFDRETSMNSLRQS